MHYRTKKRHIIYRIVRRVVITLNAVHPSIWCQQLFGANSRCHSIRSRLAHPVSLSLIDRIDQTQTETQNICNSIYFSLSLPKRITQSTAIFNIYLDANKSFPAHVALDSRCMSKSLRFPFSRKCQTVPPQQLWLL